MEAARTFWPFGEPSKTPGAYRGDRQTQEDAALSPLWTCEGWLTPTGRIVRRIEPDRFKRYADDAIRLIEALTSEHPDDARYPLWLNRAKAVRAIVK